MKLSKIGKIVVYSFLAISLLLNISIAFIGGTWLHLRMRPIPIKPQQMKEVIREFSWNSAGEWQVIEQDQDRIIVQYKLPIYDITRYELLKKDFKLDGRLQQKKGMFKLSFEGCDIYARFEDGENYECMKFRDLSLPTDSQ